MSDNTSEPLCSSKEGSVKSSSTSTEKPEVPTGLNAVKMAGYLEKKRKKKLISIWKRYWFVLEGRLLLYYKNQTEVQNLCPCRGSINMGLATGVTPHKNRTLIEPYYTFEIISHTKNTILLRTKDKSSYEQWVQALLDSLGQPNVSSPVKLTHFRYSMDSLIIRKEKADQLMSQKRRRSLAYYSKSSSVPLGKNSFIGRIKRFGGYSHSADDILNEDCFQNTNISNGDSEISIDEKTNEDIDEPNSNDPEQVTSNSSESDQINQTSSDINNINNENIITTIENNNPNLTNNNNIEEITENVLYGESEIHENDEYCSLIKTDDLQKNKETTDLYSVVDKKKSGEYIVENDEYSSKDKTTTEEKIEYYYYSCGQNLEQIEEYAECNIYDVPKVTPTSEPYLPPRKESRMSNTSIKSNISGKNECSSEIKVKDETSKKKMRLSFLQKIKDHYKKKIKKRKSEPKFEPEDDYEYVDCDQIKKSEEVRQPIGAQKTLSADTFKELQTKLKSNNEQNDEIYEAIEDIKRQNNTFKIEQEVCPGLPPRKGPKNPTPWNDEARPNTPPVTKIEPEPKNTTLDLPVLPQIQNTDESAKDSILSVQELIHKFNNCESCVRMGDISICKIQLEQNKLDEDGVSLRRVKCESCREYDNVNKVKRTSIESKNSEELNLLMEELVKITNAPLLKPGENNSLIQIRTRRDMKNVDNYGLLTDEELMALPIRKRRHSEPDYDVPRPHSSLQIVPFVTETPSPDNANDANNKVITATRFFGPALPNSPQLKDSMENLCTNRSASITPDSLEFFSSETNKNRQLKSDDTQDNLNNQLEDRTLENQSVENANNNHIIVKHEGFLQDTFNTNFNRNTQLMSDKFYDSLEQSTIF